MGYLIKNKKFKEMYKLIEDAYNMSYVLRNFCRADSYSEDLCYISPSVEYIHRNLDVIYAELINIRF